MRSHTLRQLIGLIIIAAFLTGCVGVAGDPLRLPQEQYEHGFIDGCLGTILVASSGPVNYERALAVCEDVWEYGLDGELEGIPSKVSNVPVCKSEDNCV